MADLAAIFLLLVVMGVAIAMLLHDADDDHAPMLRRRPPRVLDAVLRRKRRTFRTFGHLNLDPALERTCIIRSRDAREAASLLSNAGMRVVRVKPVQSPQATP